MEEQNRNKETAPGEARRPSSVEEAEAAIEAVLFAMGDSVELGRIAKAIRSVVKAAASKEDRKVIVDILQ